MKKLLHSFFALITFVVIISAFLLAQPNYNFSAVQGAFVPIAGGNQFVWRISPNPNDDDYTAPTSIVGPLGFINPFIYDGVPFSEIQVSVNGFLKFVNSATGDTLIPQNSLGAYNNLRGPIRNVLAPLWDDLAVINSQNDIVYQFVGPPGNRVLTIEWRNVFWDNNAPAANANFQIRLYSNNWIEYHYGLFINPPGGSASASVGMNDGTPISSPYNGVEATGTFLSINFGGSPGGIPWARRFHRSYGYEFNAISQAPDPIGPIPPQTTLFQFIPQFPIVYPAGVYTVNGPVGPFNFSTLSDAAEALNLNAIGGPITINIRPSPWAGGVWDDIFHLIPVMGTNPINTITVQNDVQYAPVIISPTNGISITNDPSAVAGDAIIRLDGTRYTTIQGSYMNGLQIIDNPANVNTISKYEIGIFLGNSIITTTNNQSLITGAQFNNFNNLYIDMNNSVIPGLNNGGATGIMFGTNGPNSDPNNCNSFNFIQFCEIVDFYRAAVYMKGFSSEVPDLNNTIQFENSFHDAVLNQPINVDCAGIDAYNQFNLTILNTNIYNLISNALQNNGVWGIRVNPTSKNGSSGALTINQTFIYNIENRNGGVVIGTATGIEVKSPYHEGLVNISNNKVYDIFSNALQGAAAGMYLNLGSDGNSNLGITNNYIYDIRAPKSVSIPSVRGLDIQSPNNVLSANIYYNTIVLDNSVATIPNHFSAGIYWDNMLTSSLDLRNNIVVNGMGSTTGIASCIYTSSNSNLLRLAYTSDNNLYRTFTVPTPITPIAFDGVVPLVTLPNYQAAVSTGGLGGPREVQSVTEMPPFVQPINPIVGGIAQDFHLTAGVASQAESGALPISGYNFDWDIQFRNPATPDIGADEWQGVLVADVIPPQILYTPLPDDNLLGPPPTLIANIQDRSGVPPGNPQLWYKRTIDPAFVPMVSIPGPGPNDFSFTINYGFLPPVPPLSVGDVIEYYVGALDGTIGPNIGTNPSGGGGMPPGIVPPVTRNTYQIVAAPIPAGTYSVGLNPFNKLIGKQLNPQSFTKIVKEKVRIERNIESKFPNSLNSSTVIDLSVIDSNVDRDYDFDSTKYSPNEYEIRDVEREYVQLMENGKVYDGPLFIRASKEDLERVGVNTDGMENVLGVYATLTAAVNDLNLRGISGAITLSLVDNNYNAETYPIDLNSVAGVSSANTITIKAGPGMTPTFTTGGGASGLAMIKITNTSFVTIDGSNTSGGSTRDLTINNINTGIGQGIWVGSLGTSPISDIAIRNSNISTGETTGSTPIMISDGSNAGSSGYFTNIKIQNDSLLKGRQGIYLNGGIIPQHGSNIHIENCNLNTSGADQLKLYGIYSQGCSGMTILNNDIGNFESVTYETDRGIWLARGTVNALVEKNKIHDLNSNATSGGTGNGGNGIAISSGSLFSNNIIQNNFIYGIQGKGSNIISQNPIGILLFGAQNGISIYNNSIYLSGEMLDQNSSFSAGIALGYGDALSSSGTFNVDVRNNIIYNKLCPTVGGVALSNGAFGIYAYTALSQFIQLNNNVYNLPTVRGSKSFGHILGLPSIGYNLPFAKWQNNSGLDFNSFDADPQYINPSIGDLHISTILGTPCESGGVNVGLADDIDGDIRNALTPDIGADEFNGTKYSITLTALIDGFYNSGTNKMVPDTVKVYLRNTSSPYAIVDSTEAVLDSNGLGTCKFSNPVIGTSYYIVFAHRNSVETWSRSGGENYNSYALNFDFTDDSAKAYEANMNKKGTKWCIFNGEVTNSYFIEYDDLIQVYNFYLQELEDPGWYIEDLTGNEYVEYDDLLLVYNNYIAEVYSHNPLNPVLKTNKSRHIKNVMNK